MLTLGISSLAGGQGKTTCALLLGRLLAQAGYATLLVDADPQHNLTTYVGLDLKPNQPTLLELLRETVDSQAAVYPVEDYENLFIIPADDQLDTVQDYLSSTGSSATILRLQLMPLQDVFDFCLVDSPPQRSQICLTVLGASDAIIIPAEASFKGYGSLQRTLDLLGKLQRRIERKIQLLGVIPFRDKWFGNSQSTKSKEAIEAMKELVTPDLVLPSMLESERFKKAVDERSTLAEIGYTNLQHPFEILIERIKEWRLAHGQ